MSNDWFHEYFINELKAIGRKNASKLSYEIVDSLPLSGEENTIYFMKSDSGSNNNHYDEYVWISSSSAFEKIGSTQIDGSTTNPDWNQNDATQPDYIKNRPFYTGDPAETVFVEENTLTFEEVDGGLYVGGFKSTFSPIVGETYKVSWDGTVYECNCENFNGLPVIGNLSIPGFGSDSGEPFIIVLEVIGEISIATADTASSHTISISGWTTQVVKIDEKYLPDTVATKSDVEAVESTANNAQSMANNAQTTANNAVKYTASQNLTAAQKQQARTNIGAGTSSFSGNYNDLANKPTIVQGDWDVNNDADMAYIKNRTHYDYTEYTRITFSETYNPVASSLINDIYYYGEKTGGSLNITSGNIYKVDSNDPTYISTCQSVPIPGQTLANTGRVLGNAQLGVNAGYLDGTSPYYPITDTGEPWCFISYKHTAKNAIISTISNFKIYSVYVQSAHELKQLDEKYIPSTIAKTSDIPTDDHIKELINTALNAIGIAEEGAY